MHREAHYGREDLKKVFLAFFALFAVQKVS